MAGRDSQGYAPSRKRCGQRSMSPTRAGTVSPLRDEPTRACMRPDRSRASTSRAAPRSQRAAEALGAALPEDVAVLDAEEAPAGFHARFSARSRSYRYRLRVDGRRPALDARRVLWWPRPVDVEALAEAAALLPGEHDFRAFTPTETRHDVFVRNVFAAALGAGRRPARLHNHRGRLSAPHGEVARRDDARSRLGSAPTRSGSPRRAAALRRRSEGAAMGPLSRGR